MGGIMGRTVSDLIEEAAELVRASSRRDTQLAAFKLAAFAGREAYAVSALTAVAGDLAAKLAAEGPLYSIDAVLDQVIEESRNGPLGGVAVP